MEPEKVKTLFYLGQVVIALLCLIVVFWFRQRSPTSAFKLREVDRLKGATKNQGAPQQKDPLRLTGIRIDGPAHEILGVSSQASSQEIQKAYRNLMKQYHPDKVGRPGTREWNDAQKIAEAINRAKDEMMKNSENHKPNRSG